MDTRYDQKIYRKIQIKHMKRCSTSYIRKKHFSLIRLAKLQKFEMDCLGEVMGKQALPFIAMVVQTGVTPAIR